MKTCACCGHEFADETMWDRFNGSYCRQCLLAALLSDMANPVVERVQVWLPINCWLVSTPLGDRLMACRLSPLRTNKLGRSFHVISAWDARFSPPHQWGGEGLPGTLTTLSRRKIKAQ